MANSIWTTKILRGREWLRSRGATRLLTVSGLLLVAVLLMLPAARITPAQGEESAGAAPQRQGLRTIMLDPGHGGQASGAVGPGGVTEKEVTLDIALRLRDLISQRLGLDVFLTREADIDVPHSERTEKANYWKADLFISIHANSYRMQGIRGPETYFLSDSASDARAARVASTENERPSGVVGETGGSGQSPAPLDFILWDLAQTEHLRESSMLAEIIQSNLTDLWQTGDRGVKQAPFLVLTGATMPAVLVEVGYISNADDAGRIADPAFRQRIAESLYRSISTFRESYAVLVGAPNP